MKFKTAVVLLVVAFLLLPGISFASLGIMPDFADIVGYFISSLYIYAVLICTTIAFLIVNWRQKNIFGKPILQYFSIIISFSLLTLLMYIFYKYTPLGFDKIGGFDFSRYVIFLPTLISTLLIWILVKTLIAHIIIFNFKKTEISKKKSFGAAIILALSPLFGSIIGFLLAPYLLLLFER